MLPNFIVIGNLRSGTTWLDRCLREHPQVFLPPHVKGTHFFSDRFHKGISWYESHFDGWNGEPAVGEVSPLCLGSPNAAGNIRRVIPAARLVACLRDPMSSIWSHYLRELRQGRTRKPFGAAIEENPQIVAYHLHFRNLARYLELFQRDQLLILLQDDIVQQPQALLGQTFRFLGVREDVRPSLASKKVNEARYIRVPFLAKAISAARWGLRDRKMYRVVEWARRVGLVDLFFGVGTPADAQFSREDRAEVRRLCRADVEELSQWLGRDLNHWLRVEAAPPPPAPAEG
jgi:hypothetical protein